MNPLPATKYRASCDGCYQAKVKCTKERPICPRCKNLGLNCKYSPSQRAGKAHNTKIQALQASKAPEWSSTCSKGIIGSSQPTTILPAPTDVLPQQQWGLGTSLQPKGSYPSYPPQIETSMTVDSPGSALPMLQDLDDINLLVPWQDYLPNIDKEQQSLIQNPTELGDFANVTTAADDTSPISTPISWASKDLELLPPSVSCNCISSLAQAIQAMSQSQPSAHPTHPPPALETVLSDSKAVVSYGETLLQCPCSDDSTSIMLFSALTAKHLSFYAATTSTLHTTTTSTSMSTGTSTTTTANSLHPDLITPPSSSTSSPPFPTTVGSSRLHIGTYTLDAEGEERLRVKIMMMQLQKLGALLAKFQHKFSSLPVGYEGQTYETMMGFLMTRLREAMERLRRLKKRLKERT
ncbi:MAG: hypothetical protein Q9219_005730 [cf. Caloplaca sp. 3 TL-2023]